MAEKDKGQEAKLAYSAQALMENRHGLLAADLARGEGDGGGRADMALVMLDETLPGARRLTLGADCTAPAAVCRTHGVQTGRMRSPREPRLGSRDDRV